MDVADWLRKLGFEEYVAVFRENAVTADVLPDLTAEDLKDLGVSAVGHRRRLLKAAAALRAGGSAEVERGTTDSDQLAERTAERRQLSVMFCDLVGSTELSSRLDPEDLSQVIRTYQARVGDTIARFGGFIARYVGDGVLIYFGWPEARETDAEWAVRAALTVVTEVGDVPIANEMLQVRIGIATGLVVVGERIGVGDLRQQTAIGETPNRAARLQGLARPRGVVIDAATRRLIGGLFECHDLGGIHLKGLPDPVPAWSVQGESELESRFEALRAGGLTPLIGREEELALLQRRWRQVARADARVVLVCGEPGIGKSRLVASLEERVQDEPCIRLRYFCSPHHQEDPLYPIIEQLKHAAGFTRNDTASERLSKLRTLLAGGNQSDDQGESLLADLLGVPSGGFSSIRNFSPQRRKELTFEALIRRLQAVAKQQPVLMLIEDLHWADPSTRELLDLTIERMVGNSILLLITFRPEFHAPWVGRADVSLMTLNRLDRNATASMAAQVASRVVPPALIERIVERTDGVPLFVEELTRSIMEAGHMAAEEGARVAVPSSLQASLLARLDRLPVGKNVAQIGAMIGRSFAYDLLAVVAALPEARLREGLMQLVESGLVLQRGTPPEANYMFKHSLIQDAAYESLLRGRRAALHERVVEAMLQQNPDAAETQAALLAHHCAEAGLIEQAISFWLKAGQSALNRSAASEAVAQLQRGLRALDQMPDDGKRRSREIDLQLVLGEAFSMIEGAASSKRLDALTRARELNGLCGDSQAFVRILFGLSNCHQSRAELTAAIEDSAELLQYANDRDDTIAELQGHRMMAQSMLTRGAHLLAREHFTRAIDLEGRCGSRTSTNSLCLFSWVLLLQGDVDRAFLNRRMALAEARRADNPMAVATALHQSCVFFQLLKDLGRTEEFCTELITLTDEHGFKHWNATGTIFRGWCIAVRGNRQLGLAEMRRGLAAKLAFGYDLMVPYFLGLIAAFLGETDRTDAMCHFADALERVERTGERWFEAELHRLKGEVLLGGPESAFPEAEFQQALSVARAQGARFFELRAAMSLARHWHDQHRGEEARLVLAPIYASFTDGHDIPDIKEARTLLETLA
jgi:class 3 adenylate cyclase/tetratricopeptide (TPR) repeat protein